MMADLCPGTRPCSAAATSAAGVSVSPEEGPLSAGRGLVVAVGGKEWKASGRMWNLDGWFNGRGSIRGRHDLAFGVIQRGKPERVSWRKTGRKRRRRAGEQGARAAPVPEASEAPLPIRANEGGPTPRCSGMYQVLLFKIWYLRFVQG